MDIRYGTSPKDFKHYTTEEIRDEFLIQAIFQQDHIQVTYSHIDRMIILGIHPVEKTLRLADFIDCAQTGTDNFLRRRELGLINIGGTAIAIQGNEEYPLEYKDGVYFGISDKDIQFRSSDPANPAKLYALSTPAHRSCPNRIIKAVDVKKVSLGDVTTSNKRVINQYIHPDVLETCQLSMGLTELLDGSIWNTMPAHTHERRMEVYFYFDIAEDQAVFHMMGQPQETRHVVMANAQAVISPSWSIHSGCGTSSYTFIWGMGGENQTFDDMDFIAINTLK